MARPLRQFLRRTLLRGPLQDAWAARRGRQLEAAYCARLVQRAPDAPAPQRPRTTAAADPLRRILLIADCMWEQQDLVPELARIAETRCLDLRGPLRGRLPPESPPAIIARTLREFAASSAGFQPDVILFYARPQLLAEEVFETLRRQWSCPLLGMNLDDKTQFFPYGILADRNDNYARWAANFDLNITNCLPATDWYRAQGCPVIYSPQGVHRPTNLAAPVDGAFRYEFSFLGTKRFERSALLDELQRRGVTVNLFGTGWPGSQWVNDANAVFRASQINLGIGFATPSSALTNIKGRDFECPGVGACYLTTYNWELPLHYELGKEILCYRSLEELVELYSFYRRRPEECLKIAQAAWRRCTAEHTWELRFRRIFREVGFRV